MIFFSFDFFNLIYLKGKLIDIDRENFKNYRELLYTLFSQVDNAETNLQVFKAAMSIYKVAFSNISKLLLVADGGYETKNTGNFLPKNLTKEQKFAFHYHLSVYCFKLWNCVEPKITGDYCHILSEHIPTMVYHYGALTKYSLQAAEHNQKLQNVIFQRKTTGSIYFIRSFQFYK